MSDLTEDELRTALTVHDRLSAVNVNAYVDQDGLRLADQLQRAALELQRHRSALAADRERVRSVVEQAAAAVLGPNGPLGIRGWDATAHLIATRAAEQLATAGVGLSESDRSVLRGLRDGLGRISLSTPESRAELALLDRLLGASK